ncbi:snake venom 5'-nucleotidase-like [Plectropomus leopardus]|uniref:snake venom 5'-nucleotidase-like n=1 Tax=Plectropomus leopardus TaxID=160734 RepID=UPI001C4D26FD|nr:snake venom 5'-nucleotidase-like [Plectropomus leopardus]
MATMRPERNTLSWLCLVLLLGFSMSTSGAWNLVLLHTNDVHARVEETSKHAGKCSISSSGCFAGVARRATMIKRIRSNESNVLLLDAGDQFQGTIWFNHYKGAEAAHFMNKLGYDAMALGNHEFDNKVEGLMKPFLEQIKFPVLSATIKPDETLASTFGSSFLPYKVLTVGSEMVGVVGYTTQETPQVSQSGPHLKFMDEVTALQPQVDELKKQGVNKIIALGHSGIDVDKEIAKKVSGVDIVIGGHSDTFLYTGDPPSTEVPTGLYPLMVESDDRRQVPIVQAYAFGKYLGYLNVTFDNDGNVLRATGNPILLDSSVPQDPEVLADVEEWKKGLANYSTQVVGNTLVFLNGTREECRFRECNLGNLICDAMVDNNIRFSNGLQWNHIGASIANGGGIRTSIDERARNGSITSEDLIAVTPFGNTVDLVELKGTTLFKIFEHSVKRYGQSSGEFLQVSGFRVEFDLSKPEGNRVTSLTTLCVKCRVPRYEPVHPETIYKVLMPSFIVQGGDGYSMIPNEMLSHNTGNLDVSVVSEYITKNQKLYTSLEGRIQILNSSSGQTTALNSTFVQTTPLNSTSGKTTPLINSALGQTTPLALLVSLGLLWSLCGSM